MAKTVQEKEALEEEVKSRSAEVYEMNEKLIFQEFESKKAAKFELDTQRNNALQDSVEQMRD